MNNVQAERVRSYLRGRLGIVIQRANTPTGGYIVAGAEVGANGQFYASLAEIAEHFNVTIPADIIEEVPHVPSR